MKRDESQKERGDLRVKGREQRYYLKFMEQEGRNGFRFNGQESRNDFRVKQQERRHFRVDVQYTIKQTNKQTTINYFRAERQEQMNHLGLIS